LPSWKLHDKWAFKIGVSKDVSRKVNKIIDIEGVHDGREVPEVFLKDANNVYELAGYSGLKAFFLHHFLDRLAQLLIGEAYREVWGKESRDIEYIFQKTQSSSDDWIRVSLSEFEHKNIAENALNSVINFVKKNIEDIVGDIEEEIR